jgi:energy-converting hydrogenase Eha subunit H
MRKVLQALGNSSTGKLRHEMMRTLNIYFLTILLIFIVSDVNEKTTKVIEIDGETNKHETNDVTGNEENSLSITGA